MDIYKLLICFFFLLSSCSSVKSDSKNVPASGTNEIKVVPPIYQTADSLFIDSLLQVIITSNFEKEKRLLQIANSFLERPYVGHTLEISTNERLVINTRELDCLTFVENIIAIYRASLVVNPTFTSYMAQLKFIRYRKGKLVDYTSRLHYYSEWMTDNSSKRILENISEQINGVELMPEVGFMSQHPEYYSALKTHPNYVKKISAIEAKINTNSYFYIPKDKISLVSKKINTGDIIGITTNIKGLDMSHTGMAVNIEGVFYLLHASSDFKKVMVTELPFVNYTKEMKSQTGIVVLRLL